MPIQQATTLFPAILRQSLDALSEGLARKDLAGRSALITESYQNRQNSSQRLLTPDDALAYALARMPATYAAVSRALINLSEVMPSLAPASLLDIGCGPGTASFAARHVFDSINRFSLLDRNGPFLDLAKQLADRTLPEGTTAVLNQDVGSVHQTGYPKADLVLASYVLAEISNDMQEKLIREAWQATDQVLLLVEPGTPDGFQRLKSAREFLITSGGRIAAPCTHESACPMQGPLWCRFMERVQRSRDHRFLKSADRSYEDEPFAYLAVTRQQPERRMTHRIIGRSMLNKFELQLPACSGEGLANLRFARRDKIKFNEFKRLDWGDALENPIQDMKAKDEV